MDIAPNRIILSTLIPITDGETEAGNSWVSPDNCLEVLLGHWLPGLMLRGSDSVYLLRGLRSCISNKLPGAAAAAVAGLGPRFEN